MLFKLLADSVVGVHFLWIVFLVFGAILGRRYRTFRKIHIGGLVFALILQIFDWYCPLTYLEVWLRQRQDPSETYAGSFIIHYLEEIIYISGYRELIAALTVLLFGFNAWLYFGKRAGKAQ